jgi:hypothetical protein
MSSPSSSRDDGSDEAAAAAVAALVAAVDEDEAKNMEVDDGEVQLVQGKRQRTTSNKALYDQFTDEGVVKAEDKDGRRHVYCIACVEHSLAQAAVNETLPPDMKKKIDELVIIKRIKRDCERHVRSCRHVTLEVKSQLELDSKKANILGSQSHDKKPRSPQKTRGLMGNKFKIDKFTERYVSELKALKAEASMSDDPEVYDEGKKILNLIMHVEEGRVKHDI